MTRPDSPTPTPEDKARSRIMPLWQDGNLFHNTKRFPKGLEGVDRLDSILQNGLIPPGMDATDEVFSELHIQGIEGYDKVVFLHRFSERSLFYRPTSDDFITFFLERDIPVLSRRDIPSWPILSFDEVYYEGIVSPNHIIGISSSGDLGKIVESFHSRLTELGIPVYNMAGKAFWPK